MAPRVLIVDHHPSFRRAARELLAARGFAVVGETECGAAARTLVEQIRPNLVIVDVRLGAECGYDLARSLTDVHPSLAVVLVSANADLGDPAHVAECGARAFVPKADLAAVDLRAWL